MAVVSRPYDGLGTEISVLGLGLDKLVSTTATDQLVITEVAFLKCYRPLKG